MARYGAAWLHVHMSACPCIRMPRVRLHVSGSVCLRVRVSKVVDATREKEIENENKDGMGMPIPYITPQGYGEEG
jgi:hypothetical protein